MNVKLWKYGNCKGLKPLGICMLAYFHISTFPHSAAFAANYDFTGEQNSNWGTAKNWRLENGGAQQSSVPDNGAHNLNFRPSKYITATFLANPVVTIKGNYSTTWKLHVRNIGTAAAPVVFRADTDAHGVTAGSESDTGSTGWLVGYDSGDAWLRLEKGTYDTNARGSWSIGGGSTKGHVVALGGVTIGSSLEFQLRNGSFDATNTTLSVTSNCRFGCQENKTASVFKKSGTWTVTSNTHVANVSGATATFRQDGGTLSAKGHLYVGNPGTGTLTLDSGTIKVSGNTFIGRGAGGTGTVTVNGGDFTAEGDIQVGSTVDGGAGTGSLVVNGGNVTVVSDKWIAFYATGKITLCGGKLTTPSIALGRGATGGTVEFDGGTLAANKETSAGLIRSGIAVKVKAGGGTVDAGGLNVKIAVPLPGDAEGAGGGMAFVGGGTVTLAGASTYTGATTVEAGTTLRIPARTDLCGGLAVAFREDAAYDGVNTLVALTGEGEAFTADDIAGVAVPENCALRLADGNRAIQLVVPRVWTGAKDNNLGDAANWSDNIVPDGCACHFGASAAGVLTNPEGSAFRPNAITFLAGAPAVTISGEAISGIAAITNLSTATCTFECPVAFADKILVVQNAKAWESKDNSSVRFAGGVTGAGFADGTARFLDGAHAVTDGSGWVANTYGSDSRWGIPADSSLTIPEATDVSELALGDTYMAGGAFTTGVLRTSARLCCYNYGDYVVTDRLEVTLPGADLCSCYDYSTGEWKFEKLVLGDKGASKWLYFGASRDSGHGTAKNIWIGAGGLDFASGAAMSTAIALGRYSGDKTTVGPWHSDCVLRTKSGSSKDIALRGDWAGFLTTDENGVARTVTADAIIYGSTSDMHIDGKGRFVCNAVNLYSGAVTVNNTATLAINEGKKVTTGAIAVNNGAALEVAESGTVALGGKLDLKPGSMLKFKFTERKAAPVLDMTGKAVTFGKNAKEAN